MRWIRQAGPGDTAALAALYRDCRRGADWLPQARRRDADFARDTAGELVLVELQAGAGGAVRPVGFVAVVVADGFIHHLYVHAAGRGQGTGTRLLSALVGRMALPWQLKCVRKNEAARRFYARRGWAELAIERADDGECVLLECRTAPD